ncbi:ankyrin repeat protein, putative [Trichomonas vaginalis G3]|uniref:Ankyrin repeat protein, putative n=1 Tax=Trichomonas vaginalis (strain ATCC PRA-98 / G3) TaxID=412133 RepID=A2E855_TRIV3|nr:ankyrin repeat and SOCS box-containing protein 4 family [Trichomonas vaginalis G3]EAY11173.1 ankyrin repeat protein, putative [Trichomonas vaginalis G3]KAI5488778.1 ankyrin repeat and SOCS box-containing protein 4 family [Trichomonas vaginalis G3]|eukprot:XP_001323396.1 ankyrin repeat protein [Trichomonas vaginalis G3]
MIKTNLIDSRRYRPRKITENILNIIPYNNRYAEQYLELAKHIYDEYRVEGVMYCNIFNDLFYKEYGIKLNKSANFEENNSDNLNVHTENTIYRTIMYNDLKIFISFTEKEGFDKDERLISKLYPHSKKGYSLLELCCYHGAVDCFKLLRTKFDSKITQKCLRFSFLGGNPEIMSECLKYQKPNQKCMKFAIISHNIDFVTFLMNEYNLEISLYDCGTYNNLESFFVYYAQTNDINECFYLSALYEMLPLCEYFIVHGANIHTRDCCGDSAFHQAVNHNNKEMAELLLSYGANINAKNIFGNTPLHMAALDDRKEMVEFLISHGANIDLQGRAGETALLYAAANNRKEVLKVLISHGANINKKDYHDNTALQLASYNDSKEMIEYLISNGANIGDKNKHGRTALHNAANENRKETTEILISHGANVNDKDIYGNTPLHFAACKNCKETAELLLSHGANIRIKDNDGNTAFRVAAENNCKETAELLFAYGTGLRLILPPEPRTA